MKPTWPSFLIRVYQGVYHWRFFYRRPALVVSHHQRWLRQLGQASDTPAQEFLNHYIAVHVAQSARLSLGPPQVPPAHLARRAELLTLAHTRLEAMLATVPSTLTPRSRTLLALNAFWLWQRSAVEPNATSLSERNFRDQRQAALAEYRAQVEAQWDALDPPARALAQAVLTAGDGDHASTHAELRRVAERWWHEGQSDELIYTLRDQINKTFLISPCYWLFDATLESLLEDLPVLKPEQNQTVLEQGRAAHRRQRAKLLNRYISDYPERNRGHLLNYSVRYRGWRVHVAALARDRLLIDDIINASLDDYTTASLLYKFDDFQSAGTAHAKFRAHLSRHGIKLSTPVSIKERKAILKQETIYARLKNRRAA